MNDFSVISGTISRRKGRVLAHVNKHIIYTLRRSPSSPLMLSAPLKSTPDIVNGSSDDNLSFSKGGGSGAL